MSEAASADQSLSGRSALVLGATGGLGSAIAADLAARGAELTLVARRPEALEALVTPGRRIALDLRDPDAVEAAVRAAVENGGRLDIVVNAVGVVAFGSVDELGLDTMEELFLTNTFIPIFLARASLDVLGDGGVFVNISGVIAEENLPGMAAYGASKAAVRSFDGAFTREARRRRIRIIDARPPHTETGLAERPIAGQAPRMPRGLDPAAVAATICDAITDDVTDLPSTAFGPR